MAVLIQELPRSGKLEVDVRVTADINVSAFSARQKVNTFVLNDISYMMHAGNPELVLADRILWRVPIVVSQTSVGDIGQVGQIDVDVETGQLLVTPQLVSEIEARAAALVAYSSSPSTG
jgi:hypothetical protein